MVSTNNIFETGAALLVNPVNICGVMGAGLAKRFAQRFPDMLRDYKAYCEGNGIRVSEANNSTILNLAEKKYRSSGWIHVWHGEQTTIVNLATKIGWVRPSYLDLIQNGLAKLVDWVNAHKPKSVAIPALGCGCGGLSWNQVYPAIVQAVKRFPACTKVWVNGKWITKEKEMSLTDVRKYIPYATAQNIARLGVPPQDYAAFGYEYFKGRWCAQHIILAANMEAVKNATSIFEIQTRWYDVNDRYIGEGAALIPTYNIKAAKDIFRNYVVKEFGAARIMEFPDKRAPMLMYGAVAAFNAITGEKLSWWNKAIKRGDIRCLDGTRLTPAPKPSVKETTLADGRRVIEDEIIETEESETEENIMKNENINVNGNSVIIDDDLELTEEFGVIDEAHRSSIATDEPETVEEPAPVKTEPVIVDKPQAVLWADAHNYESVGSPHARSLYDDFNANHDDDDNNDDDTPPVAPKPRRKMPGVIAGLNVAAALAANLTMADAAQRMGEIRKLKAQLKALGKPGVEVKAPTRPQRVRGHKLDDAVVEFEFFADFYKVLCEEFEAKHRAATTPADEPETVKVPEQKEISPAASDTVTVDEKPLPEKPEEPEDPQDPKEPSDGDNGDGEPANDNPPADQPVFDGGDNNNDGTGAASNVAAASADQDNSPADFCDEEGVPEETVPATPEELYGDAIRKVLRKYGNDTMTLGTVQLFLHDEHRLVVDFDTDEGVEVDDESLDWVAEQIAMQQVTNDQGYSPYGHDDLDDIDETSLQQPKQPQELAQQPDPEPQQSSVEDSQLMAEYKAMIEKYLKLPNYVIDGGGVLSDAEVAKLIAAKKQQDADTLTLGGQMLLAFFGDDTVRAAAELDAAINGYNPKKVKMTRAQEMQFSKRTYLKVLEGVRQDKEGNFYVKGSRGKLLHDWLRATIVDGIGFVFENPPKDRRFFR